MGGKKVTTGYWYELAWHDGLCLGPLDAYLEFRAGTKTAWSGRETYNTTLQINAPDLWGGEKDQGGIVGPLSLMLGDVTQIPHPYLVATFGDQTTAWRGVATVVFEGGKYGANNPYAQKRAHKVERIKQGWDGGGCWYPAKAPVPLGADFYSGFSDLSWALPTEGGLSTVTDEFTLTGDGSHVVSVTLRLSGRIEYRKYNDGVHIVDPASPHIITALSSSASSNTSHNIYKIEISSPAQTYYVNYKTEAEWTTGAIPFSDQVLTINVATNATVRVIADPVDGYQDGPAPQYIDIEVIGVDGAGLFAKNPAHMLVWAHTQEHCGGQPLETVNSESAIAAADWFYAHGFGLCTIRYPDKESAAEFASRIERVAGCAWSQNLSDGQWYIDIANGEYDLDTLPTLTDDDIVSFEEVPTVLDDAVNSVSIKYFDPQRKESITTPPLRAMGLIAEFGTIHQTYDFQEIPTDSIANRVAHRELLARCTPTRVFTLATTRKTAGWRRNTYFRLQCPKRGIEDMVCLLAEINGGSLRSGAVQIKATQDIYSLPTTAYTTTEPGVDTRPPSTPVAITDQVAFEAPYIDVVAAMPAADFAALPEDAGYLVGASVNPGRMRDFTMTVAPSGGAYAVVGDGEFSPSCTAVAAVDAGLRVGIGFSDGVQMAGVAVGDLALWDTEIVRVDAIDLDAGTLDLGRGCADTLPHPHAEGSRLFFYQHSAAHDDTQHIAGETVDVKLLTNSFSKQLSPADATALHVTFNERLARPYPPADFKLNGVSVYSVGTPSTGGGGGSGGTGGGGGTGTPTSPPVSSANGAPASTQPGPNGGYPDSGQPKFPLPDVFDANIIDDGDFSDPASLANWRKVDGSALGSDWFLLDGALHLYNGSGMRNAYYYAARRRLPTMSFPRYAITVTADVACDPNVTTQIGIAWGVNYSLDQPNYLEVSAPATYPSQTTISHTYYTPITLNYAGQGFVGGYTIRTVMPVVNHIVDGAPANASVDNVSMVISEVPTPVTAETPAHINFDAGLTGWVLWPDPDDTNPYVSEVSVAGGVATMTFVSNFAKFRYLVCEAPLTLANLAGKYVRVVGDVWCNDDSSIETAHGKFISGGVSFGIAAKMPDGSYAMLNGGRQERGDFSPSLREAWQRVPVDAASIHVCVLMQAAPGKTCKVRNLTVYVTDEVLD